CIRLSGCPSLTVKPNPDPLRRDPVAAVIESCVGCGLCGEVAHAAVLCPSFYRADIVINPNWWDRALAAMRGRAITWLSRLHLPPGGGGRLPKVAGKGVMRHAISNPLTLPLKGGKNMLSKPLGFQKQPRVRSRS